MNRKQFIQQLSALTAMSAAGINHAFANVPSAKPIGDLGIQLFSLPATLEEDLEGGLGMLAQMGYKELELYGPYEFSAQSAKDGWAGVTQMLGFSACGFFNRSAKDLRLMLDDLGMKVPSVHTDLITLEQGVEVFADAQAALGFEYVTIPMIPDDRRTSLDDYKRMADTFNTIGANAKKMGLKFAYHNHGYGLQEVEGVVPFDTMMDATDPALVFLEMDVFWTKAGKADPIQYLNKYAGRYHLMHIKDMKPIAYFPGDGSTPPEWFSLFPYMTNVGDGDMDIPGIITAAQAQGAKHIFVEQDIVKEPALALKRSIDYLKGL